jgi:hypothetical protein
MVNGLVPSSVEGPFDRLRARRHHLAMFLDTDRGRGVGGGFRLDPWGPVALPPSDNEVCGELFDTFRTGPFDVLAPSGVEGPFDRLRAGHSTELSRSLSNVEPLSRTARRSLRPRVPGEPLGAGWRLGCEQAGPFDTPVPSSVEGLVPSSVEGLVPSSVEGLRARRHLGLPPVVEAVRAVKEEELRPHSRFAEELAHVDGDALVGGNLHHIEPEKAVLPGQEFGDHLFDLVAEGLLKHPMGDNSLLDQDGAEPFVIRREMLEFEGGHEGAFGDTLLADQDAAEGVPRQITGGGDHHPVLEEEFRTIPQSAERQFPGLPAQAEDLQNIGNGQLEPSGEAHGFPSPFSGNGF